MADECGHRWRIESIGEVNESGTRTVQVECRDCGVLQPILTRRSADELAEELRKSQEQDKAEAR